MEQHGYQAEQGGERLDRWLAQVHPAISRSRWQKLIAQGYVSCNQQICRDKNYTVQGGDTIHITLPDPEPLDLVPHDLDLEILYEDEYLLVINKPAGLVVHPSPGHAQDTLVNALLAKNISLSGINGTLRPGIVHRLDKDTTGALVIAKTDAVHQALQAQIQAKTARRQYLGIVIGRPQQPQGTISNYIGRHPGDRQKMAVRDPEHGRLAITHWRIRAPLGNLTLMEFDLETGRTHQIRVHCAHAGWPILGDPVYGSVRPSPVKLSGQLLHA
ncbi:MAG: RluA family pseudouridine synthase, partial [Thermostichales cyanobacterium BF4_bins_65]